MKGAFEVVRLLQKKKYYSLEISQYMLISKRFSPKALIKRFKKSGNSKMRKRL